MKHPKIQIGVMGGAFEYNGKSLKPAYKIGKRIAEKNCTLITGATTGIPYAAALGAQDSGGFTVGISPAKDSKEHVEKYKKPLDGLNAVVYTGMGYNGREPINVSTCDGLIYIGGEFGTLIEFGQGFYDGKVLGVLTDVGGISDRIKTILSWMKSDYGSKIIYDSDPIKLVDQVIKNVKINREEQANLIRDAESIGKEIRGILSK